MTHGIGLADCSSRPPLFRQRYGASAQWQSHTSVLRVVSGTLDYLDSI